MMHFNYFEEITEKQIRTVCKRYLKYLSMPETPETLAVINNIRDIAYKYRFKLPYDHEVVTPKQLSIFDEPEISEYKVVYNGSHFMAVRPGDNKPLAAKKRHEVTAWDDVFADLYAKYTEDTENKYKLAELAKKICADLLDLGYYSETETCENFVCRKFGNVSAAACGKRRRFYSKASLVKFNYFCTFTYDSRKISSEEEFRKKLTKLFNNLHTRYGCLFAGAFERGGKKRRLHMHALAYIPDDVKLGEFVTTKGYSLEKHEYRKITQCTYFSERFGRNEFDKLDTSAHTQNAHIGYITKYIAKSGEKIFYSKGMPTYLLMKLNRSDVACKSNVLIKKREITRYVVADDIAFRYIDQIPKIATAVISPLTQRRLRT